jgi:hypothetical protein
LLEKTAGIGFSGNFAWFGNPCVPSVAGGEKRLSRHRGPGYIPAGGEVTEREPTMKKYLLASLAVFIVWSILDFVVHGMVLSGIYASTASLWRPMEEMNMGLMRLVCALSALAFTGIYVFQVKGGSMAAGAKYGLWFGLATGIPMGFGSFGYMPIPYSLAWGWFLASMVSSVLGGVAAGAIAKNG